MDVDDKHSMGVVATVRIPNEKSNRFGVIDIKDDLGNHGYSIDHLIEKPKPEEATSNLGIVGRYLLPPEIFDILRIQEPVAGNKIQLTDALETLNQQSQLVAYEYTGTRYDVGDKYGMLVANIEVGLQHDDTSDKMKHYIKELANELRERDAK